MLPALPTGMQSASTSPPRSSRISNAAVFWPSRRNWLTELTSAIGCAGAQLAHELERLVEVAAQRDHARAVHERLGELAGRDLALGHDHRAGQPGARRVGRRARRRVAGRGADDGLGALAHGGADRARHAAVLERAGRVERPRASARPRAPTRSETWSARTSGVEPSPQRHDGVAGVERQPVAVALDEAGHQFPNSSSMTRIARGRERMKSRPRDQVDGREELATPAAGARPSPAARFSPSPFCTTDFTDAPCRPRICATWASTPGRSATSMCR